MIDHDSQLSVRRQCSLLSLHRSTVYYRPQSEPTDDLALMWLLDEEYTRHPFFGSRRMTLWLRERGHEVNRKRVQD
jgi:putative transposase